MRALSGLTPALSRRLQQQLLAHLPPRAARSLRRTLSLTAPPPDTPDTPPTAQPTPPNNSPQEETTPPETQEAPPTKSEVDNDVPQASASHFCTLPRLRRRSSASRETTSPTSVDEFSNKMGASLRESSRSRSGARSTPDRPLLSKYLSERTNSLDDTYASDGGSIVTDPSYIAAYGAPAYGNASGQSFRRHSLRLSGDQPKKRISRFLRSDFFESPPEENLYAKHKKEKELETQKILKEIREKKNKNLETVSKDSSESYEVQPNSYEDISVHKCLSPTGILVGKDRSRSTTPFLPSLDNIKENTIDSQLVLSKRKIDRKIDTTQSKEQFSENLSNKETKIVRPKSYPAKSINMYDDSNKVVLTEKYTSNESETETKHGPSRESKLLRPKSYPNSTNTSNKGYPNRNVGKDEGKSSMLKETNTLSPETKNDVEVSFNITLPRRVKISSANNSETVHQNKNELCTKDDVKTNVESAASSLVLKKYQVLETTEKEKSPKREPKEENENMENKIESLQKQNNSIKNIILSNGIKKDDIENGQKEKKIVKKKVIKKVSSKSKTDLGSNQNTNDSKSSIDKKKVTKKPKEKSPENGTKLPSVTKKKSVFQSIGHKLEKLTSSKSNSPEKVTQNNSIVNDNKKETSKISRTHREHSVPVDPPTESNLIKRAVTVTDVAALENQTQNKTTVSKVLGLFKKFEPKDKSIKLSAEKLKHEIFLETKDTDKQINSNDFENDLEKPRRPSSLLLNGISRKSNHNKASTDGDFTILLENDEKPAKKENESKNIRNTLKLDFSKLPRVKKIVPTNPVIEPQIMNTSVDKEKNRKEERNGVTSDGFVKLDLGDTISRSRSRSRSVYSNSDVKSDHSAEIKDKTPLSPSSLYPTRSYDSTTPEKEDVVDRIRRKSFYSRFNEKKQRRKSNLVGPGATEYDPVARIYSQSTDAKYDVSPTSPSSYDLSPGYSIASDLSPSTERYRSLLADLPINTRSNLRYDGINDKVDTYRSLDRNDLRKYSGTRSYLDYDQPLSYGHNRYSRTKSLLDSSDGSENLSLSLLREPHKYNRTNSLYAPGNYATYRPKRTHRNPAIILKESEKEPSPENILDKIRQRKYSISVTRKPDPDKESLSRPAGSPQGEGDGTERTSKGD